jgi:hypothetical protein
VVLVLFLEARDPKPLFRQSEPAQQFGGANALHFGRRGQSPRLQRLSLVHAQKEQQKHEKNGTED